MCATTGREKPKIKDIQNYVVTRWASKWRQLGKQLNIDQSLLDIIEKDHLNDCKLCCTKMFSTWLQTNPTVCWEDITTAMDKVLAGMYVVYWE